jgi:DNA-binding response OmpR family regulator
MEDGRKSVPIVEDEPGIRRLMAETLPDGGFDCLVAQDGEEGLQKASFADVGAAVVDLNLPGMWTHHECEADGLCRVSFMRQEERRAMRGQQ